VREVDDETTTVGESLRKVLGMLRRRKWPMILVFLGVMTAVASTVTFLPDVYRSTATVIIERQQIPDELVRSTVTSGLEVRLQTITQEILSRTRLEDLIQKFGLYGDIGRDQPHDAVLERMRKDIRIELNRGDRPHESGRATIAFTVSYAAADPQTAALVANTLTSYFVEENLKERERVATGTADFLRTQLEEAKAKLDALEKQVSAFKQAHMGQLPQQLSANLATLEQLNGQLRVNSDRIAENNERRTALEGQLAELQGADGTAHTPDERLAALRRNLTELKTRYSDKHPDVVRAKAEIAALEQMIREAPEVGGTLIVPASPQAVQIQRQLAQLELEGRSLEAENRSLHASIAQYQHRVEMTPEREQEFAGVSREYEATQALYNTLQQRQREAELAENMEQRQKGEQFRVLDPARPANEPSAPKRGRLLLMGLVAALGLAFGLGVALEVLDPSLHHADDLKSLTSIPVVVTIPRIVTPVEARARRRRLWVGATLAATGLLLIVGMSFLLTRGNTQLTGLLMR
jgi:succinoglycan biosynthesis transport protein ExoP